MNDKPFSVQVFLPHKTTTCVILEGFGVRVSAIRSSVGRAVDDALKEWVRHATEPLTRTARSLRAKAVCEMRAAREEAAAGPATEASEEDAAPPAGPLPDTGPLFVDMIDAVDRGMRKRLLEGDWVTGPIIKDLTCPTDTP